MSIPTVLPTAGQHVRLASAQPPSARTNWAGNHTFAAAGIVSPTSVEELQALIHAHPNPLKALGAGHSFNPIADTPGTQISLSHFNTMSLDSPAAHHPQTVTVGAGVTYGQLAPWLDAHGLAVHNLASLPHLSIAGACATGTHGSGTANGSLSTAVAALEFVSGSGELVRLSRHQHPEQFPGAVIALGALGILTSITLDVQPSFRVAQTVYENLPFAELEHTFNTIAASAYSVSLFTDWQHHRVTQAWLKHRVNTERLPDPRPTRPPVPPPAPPANFHGALLQREKLHPLAGHSAQYCTEQQGLPGPWYERLPHFRMEFTPSSGAELQTEYFVPREHAWPAIEAIEQLRDHITPHLIISELRTVAADPLWLSMAYQRPSLAIHFTWKPDWAVVQHILPRIEAQLAPFHARPHWGKLFAMPGAAVRSLYPRFQDFAALRARYDPAHRFENSFLARLFA